MELCYEIRKVANDAFAKASELYKKDGIGMEVFKQYYNAYKLIMLAHTCVNNEHKINDGLAYNNVNYNWNKMIYMINGDIYHDIDTKRKIEVIGNLCKQLDENTPLYRTCIIHDTSYDDHKVYMANTNVMLDKFSIIKLNKRLHWHVVNKFRNHINPPVDNTNELIDRFNLFG